MNNYSSHPGTIGQVPLADTDLRVCLISEEAGFELRTMALAPAPPKPVPAYPYADEVFHVGAYCGPLLASVGSFILEDMGLEEMRVPGSAWRIRGMATATEFRRLGFASAVLEHGLREIRRRGGVLVWCNGRTTAGGFYRHHSFRQIGGERNIPGLQPHYRFARHLGRPSAGACKLARAAPFRRCHVDVRGS